MKLKLYTALLNQIQEHVDNGTVDSGSLIIGFEEAGASDAQLIFIDKDKQQVKLSNGESGTIGSNILYDVISED